MRRSLPTDHSYVWSSRERPHHTFAYDGFRKLIASNAVAISDGAMLEAWR